MARIYGDNNSNVENGTLNDDQIYGYAGNDSLRGYAGNDLLDGGNGYDTLDGGEGNDTMIGGFGSDQYTVDRLGDKVIENAYSGSNDLVYTTLGSYTLGANVEKLYYIGHGNFTGTGNALGNELRGAFGANKLIGLGGDDTYIVINPGDIVVEAANGGHDTVEVHAGARVTGYTLSANVEEFFYEGNNDFVLSGNAGDNKIDLWGSGHHLIYGGAGKDKIESGTSNDKLYGGEGDDELLGYEGNDKLYGGAGMDWIDGGIGNNYVNGGSGMDTMYMAGTLTNYLLSNEDDIFILTHKITGETNRLRNVEIVAFADGSHIAATTSAAESIGNDSLHGDDGANAINGLAGNDTITGLGGLDTLAGGAGNDTYLLGAIDSWDVISEAAGGGTDTVLSRMDSTDLRNYANVENLTIVAGVKDTGGDWYVHGFGNALNNVITGYKYLYNELRGEGGNDLLIGGMYWNGLYGGSGNDTLVSGGGDDYLDGGQGADKMTGGTGDDNYYVDNAGDQVIEIAGEGWDNVTTTLASYTLGATVEGLYYQSTPDTGLANFTGTGNAIDNDIMGGAGNDTLKGLAGDDRFYETGGDDRIDGGTGNDTMLLSGLMIDYIFQRISATTVRMTNGVTGRISTLTNVENYAFYDAETYDTGDSYSINEVGLRNQATGWADYFDSATSMEGLGGNDIYVVDDVGDIVTETASFGSGTDTVLASVNYTLAANVEHLTLTGIDGITGTGNTLANTITGNSGSNALDGGAGNDKLNDDNGNDTLDGGAGSDTMTGGFGDDTYHVDGAGDKVVENYAEGIADKVITTYYSYTLGANVENLEYTGTANFTGTGNELSNRITGSTGNDKLTGGGGYDTLTGGAGNDSLSGGDGNDSLFGGTGNDTLAGGNGGDTAVLLGALYDEYTFTRTSDTTVRAVRGGQTLTLVDIEYLRLDNGGSLSAGSNMNETVLLNRASTYADYFNDAATMAGLGGNDTYVVDSSDDVIYEAVSGGTDTVLASDSYALAANVEKLTLTGSVNINGTGNALANTLTGNSADNILSGGAGNDTLIGGDGNDTLRGETGSDSMTGGMGNDTYYVDNAGDKVIEDSTSVSDSVGFDIVRTTLASYVLAANVEVLFYDGSTNFNGTGNAIDNELKGGAGNDTLKGLAGDDWFYETGGDDSIDGGADEDTMILFGSAETYDFVRTSATTVRVMNNATDDILTLTNVERYAFSDGEEFSSFSSINEGEGALRNMASAWSDYFDSDDVMIGLGGNDTYVVDSSGDIVTEALSGGTDTVLTRIDNYQLADNVERLTIAAEAVDGDSDSYVAAYGNALANTITGNNARNALYGGDNNDTLIGGGGDDYLAGSFGNDSMIGGIGNDSYHVDSAYDKVVENAGEGQDSVIVDTITSYKLGANVEELSFTGSANCTGTGNELDNIIRGAAGNDKLNGATGADTLYGFGGNDTLNGGLGNDVLVGDDGSDSFLFNTAIGPTNIDLIFDFTLGQDFIQLENAIFTKLTATGSLGSSLFETGVDATFAATRIVYDGSTGELYYDADGSGDGEAVQIATLVGTPELSYLDFKVV